MIGLVWVYLENLLCFLMYFMRFPRRKLFPLRFFPAAALLGWVLYLITPTLYRTNLLVIVYYLIEFTALMAVLHFSFRTSWWQALYCASAGRATQHLIYQLLRLIGLRFDISRIMPPGLWGEFLEEVVLYLPFCLVFYLIFARRVDTSDYEKNDFRRIMNLLSVAILFICIGITRFAKSSTTQDTQGFIAESLYAITCCLLCLIMQFEFYQRARLTKEVEMVRMLWKKDSKQMAERKDIIELINMKCHDIRHKLEDYHLPLSNDEEREIKSLIQIYDQTYHTGNPTLDVLLADRTLLCEKDRIQLSFLGDGGCLSFLNEGEIFSLFSNALGNAMEAARRVEEAKRQVSILVRSSGDLVSISVTNYYQGELEFEDDLPVTTRPDAEDFHGYGIKSMRAIARKYGGRLKIKTEDGVFNLTIWLVNSRSRLRPGAWRAAR